MAVAPRTNQQRIRVLSIAVIFFVIAGIATWVISTVNLVRLRNQTIEIRRISKAAEALAKENASISAALLASQTGIQVAADEAKRTAVLIADCVKTEGTCYKEAQARQEAQVEAIVSGVSSANRRLIRGDVKKVEQTAQTQGEATRAAVEEKTEQVKEVVVGNPPALPTPPCALELGGVALLCTIPPKEQ